MKEKEVKNIDVVKLLRLRGHEVNYIKRKDGGIRITKIDGVSYKGSSGNKVARDMAGVTLSEARKKQLKTIKTEKGHFGHKKKSILPKEVLKKISSVQRVWKKNKVHREGYVGRRGARYNVEHYGQEEALRVLSEQEKYARGIAYSEVVEWLISEIRDKFIPKAEPEEVPWLQKAMDYIQRHKAVFKEEEMSPIHDTLYDYRDGKINARELYQRIVLIHYMGNK